MSKKSGSLFWGSFFISMGVCFLLLKFDVIDFHGFTLGYYWPVLLIIFGISLLKLADGWKKLLSAISGFLFAFIVTGIISNGMFFFKDNFFKDKNTSLIDPISSIALSQYKDIEIKQAILNFEGGSGAYIIKDFYDSTYYLKADSYALGIGSKSYYNKDSIFTIDFSNNFNLNKITNLINDNLLNLKLRDNIEWTINMNTGACEMDLDFHNLKVSQLNIQTGVSSLDLNLGDKVDTCKVDIENGVSEMSIDIPEDVNCRIYSNSALSSESFIGFVNRGDYFEATPNSETKKYIEISIEGGISDYTITRSQR